MEAWLTHTRTGGAALFTLTILWGVGCAEPVMPSRMPFQQSEKNVKAVEDAHAHDEPQRAAHEKDDGSYCPDVDAELKQEVIAEADDADEEIERAMLRADAPDKSSAKPDERVAQHEQGDQPAEQPLRQVDAGARALVEQLKQRIDAESYLESETVTIGLSRVENMSRARRDEFDRFKSRLATLLTVAGRKHGLEFTSEEAHHAAGYELIGSAYLILSDGFDLWELHLMLKSTDRSWIIWTASDPVYVLRAEREVSRQIFFGQSGGR